MPIGRSAPYRFAILGPVRAWHGTDEIDLGPPQQRMVLAALLMSAGASVPLGHLLDALWDGDYPRSAEHTVRTYIYRLRRSLAQVDARSPLIRSIGASYLLEAGAYDVDLADFRRLTDSAERARRAGDSGGAVESLRHAVELWKGEALAGLTGRYVQQSRDALDKLRLNALETLNGLQVELGSYQKAIEDLMPLVAAYPLDERFRRLLMLALHNTGQQAAALAVYQDTQRVLAAELGIDPGPALQELNLQILRGSAPMAPLGPAAAAGPAQLPADLLDFTGREKQMRQLDLLLPTGDAPPGGTVVAVIHGMGGAGKTALAVHWAHQVADRFPDGEVYLNLRGFHPTEQAMSAGEAQRVVLESFGVRPEQVSADPDAQTAQYRTMLARRRVLILLDNAADAEQVRPLVPGSAGCFVLVTSRARMSGLIAREQARSVEVHAWTDTEGRGFLRSRAGLANDEREWVSALLEACGHLPLALSIVAARIVMNPQWSMTDVMGQLNDGVLGVLGDPDQAVDLSAVFSWSLRRVSRSASRAFTMLALHPGPDAALSTAASVLAWPVGQTRAAMAELTEANLVREHRPGRYVMHDLLREYAAELARTTEVDTERRAAVHRLLDHYLHATYDSVVALQPQWQPPKLPPALVGVVTAAITDHHTAREWLTTEHHALVAMIRLADRYQFEEYIERFAATVSDLFQRHGHWREQVYLQQLALDTGERTRHVRAQADARRSLGSAYARLNRPKDAAKQLSAALELYDGIGDLASRGRTHRAVAYLHGNQREYQLALIHSERALHLYQSIGDEAGIASALNDRGWCHALLGDHQRALADCRGAMAAFQRAGSLDGMASTLDSLGYIHAQLGALPEAVESHCRAGTLFRQLGDRYNEAISLVHLGDCYRNADDFSAAELAWKRALELFDDLGHVGANQVRIKLDGLAGR